LNTSVTAETVDGRMSVDGVTATDDAAALVVVGPDFVDEPLADTGNLKGNAVVSNQTPDAIHVFFL
jgi:hypothetical protein